MSSRRRVRLVVSGLVYREKRQFGKCTRVQARHRHATPHLARAGSSAMVLPPMAFRPALLPCTMRRAAEDAINGARMAELATVSAAALARSEPHDNTLWA